MTLAEFKETLAAEEILAIKAVAEKKEEITAEDKETLHNYIEKSSKTLGDDQIAEPVRYILASMGGLRKEDLQALIGEDFDAELFEQWNNLLETPVLSYRTIRKETTVYDVAPKMRELLREEMGESNFRSCASDIGYYLLTQKETGDIIRDTQCLHLLLDGMEAAAAAEYVTEVVNEPLQMAVNVLAKGMKDAPEYVKATIWDMVRAEGEKIDTTKILMILLNDCVKLIGNPENTKAALEKLHSIIGEVIAGGNKEISILLGMAKLRIAQCARMRRDEQEAQKWFIEAMNYLMPSFQIADPATISQIQIRQYWICMKICQEMAQPKAMIVFFEQIIKVEQLQTLNTNLSEDERTAIAENIVNQHIDVSKVYHAMPKELKEQFKDYTEPTITLLKTFLGEEKDSSKPESEQESLQQSDMTKLSGFYQALGELYMRIGKNEESYDALTEAQILQMRNLAALQKQDGADAMSPQQLFCRLALSATNHMIASYYRHTGKNNHDLGVLLRSNMNLAEDCFKFYPRDPRVLHFFINAALELGDYQHQSRGLLAECGTYEKVVRQFAVLNNMNLDQQLAMDVAMIQTKCGQAQADKTIRRFKDAIRNLETARQLWKALADNTKNPQFAKNLQAVETILAQLKGPASK